MRIHIHTHARMSENPLAPSKNGFLKTYKSKPKTLKLMSPSRQETTPGFNLRLLSHQIILRKQWKKAVQAGQ